MNLSIYLRVLLSAYHIHVYERCCVARRENCIVVSPDYTPPDGVARRGRCHHFAQSLLCSMPFIGIRSLHKAERGAVY